MKKIAKIFSLITAFSLLCGCSRIPDRSDPEDSGSGGESDPGTTSNPVYNETGLNEYTILTKDFIAKLHAESGVYDGALSNSGKFDGQGYVKLHTGNSLTHILQANTSQHYRVVLAARSADGAAVSLESGGIKCGTFYIPPLVLDKDGSAPFTFSEVDCLYFKSGQNNLKFTVESGSVDIDYILVENAARVDGESYSVGSACANPNASLKTVNTVKYFSEAFGQLILTAQNVSPASNAEIDAVYNATGRYPAIRSSEIAYATLDTADDKQRVEDETELAVQWCEDGGIQGYTWHWYSPNIRHSVNAGDFNLDVAFENQNPEDVAMLTDDAKKALVDNGYMPLELSSLLDDIDKMAELFKKYDDADAVVLFEPIPNGDTGAYWWGSSPENYKTLWQILFTRLCRYHKIHCLVWVWSGSNMDYYPGSNYVDIVGQSFFETSDASYAGRFQSLSSILPSQKILAVNSCDVMPNIDKMYRDNALWLWTAPAAGDYTLNMNGALSESYNTVRYMKAFYNHKFTVARDELPTNITGNPR